MKSTEPLKLPWLSDRAFQIVKNEIERRYSDHPNDQIERVILLARLETLRASRVEKGKPMSRVQIWEVLSDVAPNFDQGVLMDAESVETDSPLIGVSIGVGAVAALVATAVGMESVTKVSAAVVTETHEAEKTAEVQAVTAEPNGSAAVEPNITVEQASSESKRPSWLMKLGELGRGGPGRRDPDQSAAGRFGRARSNTFETAKGLGWQAALKSQDPPHSLAHWNETAELWRLAIAHLEQIPAKHDDHAIAKTKKALYQENLKEIQKRQKSARERAKTASLKADQKAIRVATPTAQQVPQFSGSKPKNLLKTARRYGWQAAVASQNAPHPPEKWAEISRLWQAAINRLDSMSIDHPQHAEAQQVKARYKRNLAAIRDRYQQEQTARQTLQSLQATLTELDNDTAPNATQYGQLEAIVQKLRSIPPGTEAHFQAQKLAAQTAGVMDAIAANPNTQVTISAGD